MAEYISGAEGFDIYSAGTLANNGFPWAVMNATLAPQILALQGAFGGNALTFPTSGAPSSLTLGSTYTFQSTMSPIRGKTSGGGSGAFAINFWLYVSSMTDATSGTLLGLGSSANIALTLPLLNISKSSTAGLNLQFTTNVNSPSSSPINYQIQLQSWYWVSISFAYYSTSTTASTGTFYTSVSVNNSPVITDTQMTWNTDVFSSGQIANLLQFYGSSNISYYLDDLIIQSVSSADSSWPVASGSYPTPETIPNLPSRRIWAIQATGAGSNSQWTPSGSEPNWQSATDPTGTNYVTATDTGQVDTYVWNCPAINDVNAVVMRGNTSRYQNVTAVECDTLGSTPKPMKLTYNGPSGYISISETNSTGAAWTTSTINGAEFGQTSK